MTVASVVTFEEVKDHPSVRMSLPAVLPLGERLRLKMLLRRKNGPRSEELRLEGDFRVTEVVIDTTCNPPKQLLKVAAVGVAPSWKAIRNQPSLEKKLPPTHSRIVVD